MITIQLHRNQMQILSVATLETTVGSKNMHENHVELRKIVEIRRYQKFNEFDEKFSWQFFCFGCWLDPLILSIAFIRTKQK